jgi:uncharacterized membrane protein YkgB
MSKVKKSWRTYLITELIGVLFILAGIFVPLIYDVAILTISLYLSGGVIVFATTIAYIND